MQIHQETREKVMCLFCEKTFYNLSNLRQHCEDYHHEQKNYDFSNLEWHAGDVKPSSDIMCVVCKTSFARLENLQKHMASYHFNHRPKFNCKSCGEHFISNSTLSKHTRIFHAGEDSKTNSTVNDIKQEATHTESQGQAIDPVEQTLIDGNCHSNESTESLGAVPHFEEVHSNQYSPEAKKKLKTKMLKCNCLPESKCANECHNRITLL